MSAAQEARCVHRAGACFPPGAVPNGPMIHTKSEWCEHHRDTILYSGPSGKHSS